jgi:ribosomal protein L23
MSINKYQLAGVLEAPIISEKSTNAAERKHILFLKCKNWRQKNKLKMR